MPAPLQAVARRAAPAFGFLHRSEELIAAGALAVMAILPLAEIVVRPIVTGGIPGSIPFVQHLTLWVGFLGAGLAARQNKLIALATATFIPDGTARRVAQAFAATVGAAVSAVLAWSAIDVVAIEMEVGGEIALGMPSWVFQLVLPFAFGVIAVRLGWRAGGWGARATAAAGILIGLWLSGTGAACADEGVSCVLSGGPGWPWVVLVVLAALAGAPIFTVLAGAAVFLYMVNGDSPAFVPLYAYDLATEPHLPAIPLFTLAGFILAQGQSSGRLLRVFRALVGWLPGGTAVVCAVVCAFFTIFTGGSGVTILALGGLLLPALLADGYRDRFSVGLLTASGSLGLLLPPAMPLILYAIVAQTAPENLFIGGILPGVLLIALVAAWGMREGIVTGAGRHAFAGDEARKALWAAKWELALPLVVLGALFSGRATLVETSALTVLYAAIVTGLVHRDFRLGPGLRQAFRECVVLIGGVLIILGVAKGFTAYMVDVDIPFRLLEWTQARIESPLLFLLALNVFLLIVGCVMDIFSAIVVVVPLISTIGAAYGIDPVHLGIIFIANLELGYLTPPVGLNLFLASYRFDRPLLEVYRASVPLLVILGIGVLVITYVPWLTLGLLELVGRQ
ncbi:MAG: TRAP transporter large permease subunit [Acidobacteria bacterium]|nr:TRAP transporter large permease subunit [Acidobacteriota bacterium]MYH28246.1 TRAP transporter large permease subunit [Acidobacteriota bacterium]